MAWTITPPLAAPVVNPAVLVSGGTLAANTTYYFRVMALVSSNYYTVTAFTTRANTLRSPASAEQSVTTDTTNKSFTVSWAAVTGATRYQVFMTTISGDYSATNSCFVQTTSTSATISSPTSALNTAAFFAMRSTDILPGNLSKENGNLYAVWSGSGTADLAGLQSAINTAGYSGYCYYDGTVFALQGSIFIDSAATGSMTLLNQHIYLLWGAIYNEAANSAFNLQFGRLNGALVDAVCTISLIIWSIRFPTKDQKHYGTLFNDRIGNSASSYSLRYGGDDRVLVDNSAAMQSVIFDGVGPAATSTTPIVSATSNTSAYTDALALVTYDSLNVFQLTFENKVFDGTIVQNSTITSNGQTMLLRKLNSTTTEYLYLIDTSFPNQGSNLPIIQWQLSGSLNYPNVRQQYTYNPTIQDEQGNALVGATVTIKDVTGASFGSSPYTTNSNGQISAPLTWAEHSCLTPGGSGLAATTTVYKGPYTITIVKAGYKTSTLTISPTTKTQGFISLQSPKSINMSSLIKQST